jgi:hypothetical protein
MDSCFEFGHAGLVIGNSLRSHRFNIIMYIHTATLGMCRDMLCDQFKIITSDIIHHNE